MAKAKNEERRLYQSEPLARSVILTSLAQNFSFIEEVKARSAEGYDLRIDAVGTCRTTGWAIGFEFKRSHLFKSEFADTMRQAIHYRLARITDPRLPSLDGKQLAAIAIFPDWLGKHDVDDISYPREAEGMRLVGAQFRVGTMRQGSNGKLTFIMGQGGIWNSVFGWSKTAEGVLFGKRGLGSTRKYDSDNVI